MSRFRYIRGHMSTARTMLARKSLRARHPQNPPSHFDLTQCGGCLPVVMRSTPTDSWGHPSLYPCLGNAGSSRRIILRRRYRAYACERGNAQGLICDSYRAKRHLHREYASSRHPRENSSARAKRVTDFLLRQVMPVAAASIGVRLAPSTSPVSEHMLTCEHGAGIFAAMPV